MREPFSFKKRLLSFRYALRGIYFFFSEQHNARIHAVAAIAAIALGFWLEINRTEWCIITICIAGVFAMEMINTAIEYLADVVSPEQNPKIGKLKDIAAGAVLVFSFAALICGLLIFGFNLIEKLK